VRVAKMFLEEHTEEIENKFFKSVDMRKSTQGITGACVSRKRI
jgi:hypothetical protein